MKKLIPVLFLTALLLCACAGNSGDHTVITFDGDSVTIQGGGAKDTGSAVTISATGTYEVTGSNAGGKALVIDTGDDAMDVTLILNNADLSCLSGPAIHVKQAKNFRLQLADDSKNRLASGTEELLENHDPNAGGAALYSEDDMDIEGNGSLEVFGYLNNGIGCKDDLDINSGAISVVAANNGIKGNDSVQIKGGSLTVSARGDGIKTSTADKDGKGYVEISGGVVALETWGDGIQAAAELRLTGGVLTVNTLGGGAEQSSKALRAEGDIRLTGGDLVLSTLEDGIRSAAGDVEITGGSLDLEAMGDGIQAGEKDSGLGDVTITGGETLICAGKQAVKARGGFSVTGGSLAALCGSDKQPAPLNSISCLRCAITGFAGDAVQIGSETSLTARLDFKCLLYVDGGLAPGETLTVTAGSRSATATVF